MDLRTGHAGRSRACLPGTSGCNRASGSASPDPGVCVVTWLTWRQHRSQFIARVVLCIVLGAFLVVTGLGMRSTYHSLGVDTCLAARPARDCTMLLNQFRNQYSSLQFLIPLFLLLPVLLGVFWAPSTGCARSGAGDLPAGLDLVGKPPPLDRDQACRCRLGRCYSPGRVLRGVVVVGTPRWQTPPASASATVSLTCSGLYPSHTRCSRSRLAWLLERCCSARPSQWRPR